MLPRIAAHAADVAKGLPGAKDWDCEMSEARRNLDWEKHFELAIDPEKARRYRAESKPEKEDTCTMCGKMCAVRNIIKIFEVKTSISWTKRITILQNTLH